MADQGVQTARLTTKHITSVKVSAKARSSFAAVLYNFLHDTFTDTLPDWIKFKVCDTLFAVLVYLLGKYSERLRGIIEDVLGWP